MKLGGKTSPNREGLDDGDNRDSRSSHKSHNVSDTRIKLSSRRLARRLARWLDEWKMAFSGIVLATREWKFLLAAGITFVIFGVLINLLSGSTSSLDLFWATDLSGKLSILGNAFLAIFGVGRNFWDWALLFFITILQSALIGLVVLVWQKRRRNKKAQVVATAQNADNVQSAGLAAGLAILGSGCPTCGTTLLMPVIGTLFSSSSYMLAGIISGILTAAAILLALWSLKRIGKDAYAMIVSERFCRRHPERHPEYSSEYHPEASSKKTINKEPTHGN